MFGQNNDNSSARGPIALTDDDMTGATGLDWEDLEARLHDEEDPEQLGGGAQRPKKQVRYADDADEDAVKPLTAASSELEGRYTDDNDESDGEEDQSAPYRVVVEEERVSTAKEPARTEIHEARTDSDETLLQEVTTQKDLFKLDDTDSELEV